MAFKDRLTGTRFSPGALTLAESYDAFNCRPALRDNELPKPFGFKFISASSKLLHCKTR